MVNEYSDVLERTRERIEVKKYAVLIGIVTVIGPPRDYLYATMFPQWMVFAPGVAPIAADGATYAGVVIVGHAVMPLYRRPRDRGPLGATAEGRG